MNISMNCISSLNTDREKPFRQTSTFGVVPTQFFGIISKKFLPERQIIEYKN